MISSTSGKRASFCLEKTSFPVGEHVELALRSFDDLGLVLGALR